MGDFLNDLPNPVSLLGGLSRSLGGGSLGNSLKSLFSRAGEDDILLILLMILLISENTEDDWLILVILGIILLT